MTLTTKSLSLLVLCALSVGAAPSAADPPRWEPLTPPNLGSSASVVFDSQRDRDLVVASPAVWSVSRHAIPRWSLLLSSRSARELAVYEPARDRLWSFDTGTSTFGGTPGVLTYWSLGDATPAWVPSPYTGASPGTLSSFGMAYDPTRNRVMIFGGLDRNLSPVNRVWLLSLNSVPNWSIASVSGTPPTLRFGSSAVYDPFRDRLLVFGGNTVPTSSMVVDEVWALSLSTLTWRFLPPRGAHPSARAGHSAIVDSVGARMIVFSGNTTDTWGMDLSLSAPADSAVWEQLSPGVPLPASAYDAVWLERSTRRLLRYGTQLWSLDAAPGSTWSLLADSLRVPSRWGHVAMVDGVTPEWHVGLGGMGDVWSRPFEAEQPWRIATAGGGPGVRYGAGAVTDVAGARSLVFGGALTPAPIGQEFADLWAYQPATSTWQLLTPVGSPTPRAFPLVVFDPVRRRVLVHGGHYTLASKRRTRDDLWAYDVAANTWTPVPAGTFGGRWGEAGIYDPIRDRLIALGGQDTLGVYSDVHQLPMTGGVWSVLATSNPAPFDPYRTYAAAYDAVGDRMLVLATNDSALALHALSLDGTSAWTTLQPAESRWPPGRDRFAIAVEPGSQRILVSGGEIGDEGWLLYPNGGQTPVLASLVSSHATSNRVRIVWQLARGATDVVPQRRGSGDEWTTLPELRPDGEGRVVLEDHGVEPGGSYEYRARFAIDGTTGYTTPVSIRVPLGDRLELEGPMSNPVTGPLYVRFSLGLDPAARLDLLDLAGRRVVSRPVGSLGAGSHVFRLAEGDQIPAGMYFLQLRSDDRIRSSRVTVLR